VLSALIVTIGGAYVSGHQKCESDANGVITNYYELQIEMMRRLEHIQHGVAKANSIGDVLQTLSTQPNVYVGFKQRTTQDLHYELIRTEHLIDFSKAQSFIDAVTKKYVDRGPPFKVSPYEVLRYGAIMVGEQPSDLREDELDRLKTFVERFIYHSLSDLYVHNQVRLSPNCNFINSIRGVGTRGPRKVIEVDS
jgi:hypothetical protein